MRFAKVSAIVLALAAAAIAADWPQWRGPHRDGISQEAGLMAEWPADGPPLGWKAQGLGEGYAGLAVAQGRIYTQGQRGDQQFVIAIDEATGKKLWEVGTGRAYHESRGNGPRGTPTIDGDRLYALAADGTFVCLEARTGKQLWRSSFTRDFSGGVPHWGYSESPLIDGNNVVATPGGRGAAVVAFNKMNGTVIWKSQDDGAGYSSPVLAEIKASGQPLRQIIVLTDERAVGLRADNGQLLWSYDKISNRTANIATPIYRDGHVFLSTDYGTGCVLLRLTPDGKAAEVYFNREMRNHYSTSVLQGEYLYGFSSSTLTAMNWATGEVIWRDRSVGKGSLTLAEGHLYLLGENGTVGLARATPSAYREKSRFSISRGSYPTWTPPVVSNGRLYLRDQDTLFSYSIKAK